MKGYILGVHYGHDATVCLIKDGKIFEVMSEERLSRQKKHCGFPHLAVKYIKDKYKIENFPSVYISGVSFESSIFTTIEDNKASRIYKGKRMWFLRAIGSKYPLINFFYKIRDYVLNTKGNLGMEKKTRDFLEKEFPGASIEFIHHHLAHAWAAVPFFDDFNKRRIILTLDGEGDDSSGSINIFQDGDIEVKEKIDAKNSIGLFYSAVVDVLGMSRNEHEFKVMGLAPYAKKNSGEKVYEKLKELIWFDENSMAIKSKIDTTRATGYLIANDFNHHRFDSMAYGIQRLTEEIIKDMARAAIKKYDCGDVAVAGGVFMNVKANQYLFEMPEVGSLVVPPSCGDESLALGCAVYGYAKQRNGDLSKFHKLDNLYLGSEYTDEEIKKAIDNFTFSKEVKIELFPSKGNKTIEEVVADILSKNGVVGRLKGRAEWGARALGNRSILANPSSRDNVKLINEMIKGRDFWMPFATSILYEDQSQYLANPKDYYAPFMAITFETKEKAHGELAAALHPYDLTSRPQMVKKEINPDYYALISAFKEKTGIAGVLNTSFNLHGEPNVETPYDALRTFDLAGLPYLAIGNYLLSKI